MLKKRVWIPILSVLLVVIGCGLFYSSRVGKQAPAKVYKPVEVQQSTTPKPPPPGETAESGHWHGDEWHAEPHSETPEVSAGEAEPHTPQNTSEITAKVQSARAIAQQANAQTAEPTQASSPRTQEDRNVERAWIEWGNKHLELAEALSQASKEMSALTPGTEEELKRFEKDPELQRKFNEAFAKFAKIDAMLRAHEEKKPVRP